MNQRTQKQSVDQNEIRTHQILVLTGLVLGYITNQWLWVAAQAGIFLITVLLPSYGPYVLVYKKVLNPLGLVKSDIRVDVPQAHRFAMSIGLVVTASSSYLLYSGSTALGWGLVLMVLVLGTIAQLGWCAGCYAYFMLNRLGLGGFFKHSSISGIFPGARPGR